MIVAIHPAAEVVAVVVRGGEEEVEALAGVGLHGAEVQIAPGRILGTWP